MKITRSLRRTIPGKIILWWTRWLIKTVKPRRWTAGLFAPAQRLEDDIEPVLQFVVRVAKHFVTFQLIRGEPQTHQHAHENETIPELQPPLDGFEDHRQTPN